MAKKSSKPSEPSPESPRDLRGAKPPPDEATIKRLVREVEADLDRATTLFFAIGDRLRELLTVSGLNLKEANERYFPSRNYSVLSMCLGCAEEFGAEERKQLNGAAFREAYSASAQRRRMVRAFKGQPEKVPTIIECLRQIQADRYSETKPKAVARAYFDREKAETKRVAKEEAEKFIAAEPPESWAQNFIHSKFQDAWDRVAPKSLALAWFDPMYPYHQPGGLRRTLCSGASVFDDGGYIPTQREALRTYIQAIRGMAERDLLTDRGMMMIWSGGGELDEPAIVRMIRRSFGFAYPLYWRKPTQAGSQYKLFACSTERVILVARSRDALRDWDDNRHRSQELHLNLDNFKSPTRSAVGRYNAGTETRPFGEISLYEKPIDLCSYLLEKLTLPGDLVWDMCGNRATMIEAAIQGKRRWLYTECDQGNYAMGLKRIRALLGSAEAA